MSTVVFCYSALSAGNSGDLNVAQVARIDAVSPDINTARSSKPRETPGTRPPRSKNTGAIAMTAQTAPVNSPQVNRKKFSANTVNAR